MSSKRSLERRKKKKRPRPAKKKLIGSIGITGDARMKKRILETMAGLKKI